MLKMVYFVLLCFLHLICFTGARQESFKLLNLYEPTPIVLQALSRTGIPIAVSVSDADLNEVSTSVLMAESWVRTHVLTHFPATKITAIIVGNTVLCHRDHSEKWVLVLPSVKNIYYSLVRWGLENEIKVSAAFSNDCLLPDSATFRDDIAERVIEPLLLFLQNSNSTYSVNPPPDISPSFHETINLVSVHVESMKKLGFFKLNEINVIISRSKEKKPRSRKLSFMSSKVVEPYPARPTPLPELPSSPIRSSIGISVPAHIATASPPPLAQNPFPPLAEIAPPPSFSFSFAPENPPIVIPSNPPEVSALSPCNAVGMGAPTPETGEHKGLWCVAKPSVPAEALQEPIDYACGEGGADCEEIRPHGSCYYPDTVIAHASFAFNSYWQKNKNHGGSCSFGGTAMLINADPSFLQCRFILN